MVCLFDGDGDGEDSAVGDLTEKKSLVNVDFWDLIKKGGLIKSVVMVVAASTSSIAMPGILRVDCVELGSRRLEDFAMLRMLLAKRVRNRVVTLAENIF